MTTMIINLSLKLFLKHNLYPTKTKKAIKF
jgi:hypothetical protein